MKILTLSLAGMLVAYLVVVIIMTESNGPLAPSLNERHTLLVTVMMVLAFACLLAAKKILANGILNAKNSLNGFSERLNVYRKSFIVYLVVLETPAWITLTLYLLTGSFPFLALGAVLLGLILSSWPGSRKLNAELGMDQQQMQDHK